MYSSIPSHLPNLPVYQKALEILFLSRRISLYFIPDLNYLKQDGKEDNSIYFTGDIIQQSNSLVPEIVEAENKSFSEDRQEHLLSISRLTSVIDKNCERLESINSNGKDFLPILRDEIEKFRQLQHVWMLTL